MNLSTVSQIENAVCLSNDFSFTNQVGMNINNRPFSDGFIKFYDGENSEFTYLYQSISAISEEIGDTIYNNIKKYIDLVSNVDLCKVKSLKSMMRMLNIDYRLIENIENIPLDLLNLLNVLSINKKYLIKGGVVNPEILESMSSFQPLEVDDYGRLVERDPISCYSGYTLDLSSDFPSNISDDISAYNIDVTTIDSENYYKFLERLYFNYIYDQIVRQYNVNSQEEDRKYYIYPYLGSKYFQDKINESLKFSENDDDRRIFKRQNGIEIDFNEKDIVDDINSGRDSIDNYTGAELSIINMEIEYRNQTLELSNLGQVGNSMDNMKITKYSYYLEQKVLEYAKFVDHLVYMQGFHDNQMEYDFDPTYYEISSSESQKVITLAIEGDPDPSRDISLSMIQKAARYLAHMTVYITDLREKIKLQMQKTYMKGTNLLLIYIINEYLNAYGRHNSYLDDADLSSVKNKLSNHSFAETDDSGQVKSYDSYTIHVNEFYDNTEYFNIKTDKSSDAINGNYVNSRYWEDSSSGSSYKINGDGLNFSLQQIENFYLSTLAMNNDMTRDDLTSFLGSIYDLGANDSYFFYNLSGNATFSSILSSGIYAQDIYQEHENLNYAWTKFKEWLSADDYTYPESTEISNQISNVLDTYIFSNLSNEYLSAVSSVYDKYITSVDILSDKIQDLKNEYNDFLSGDYSYYYKKSEVKYCYENHDVDYGTYLHDYYIGNSLILDDSANLYESLYQLQSWSNSDNIKIYPIYDQINYISGIYDTLTRSLETIRSDLESNYGFTDIDSDVLGTELQYTYDFVKSAEESRREFLKTQLQSLLTQSQDLKSQYDNLENTFTQAMASYTAGGHQTYSYKENPTVYCVTSQELNKTLKAIYGDNTCSMSKNYPKAKAVSGWGPHYYPEVTKVSQHSTYSSENDRWYWQDEDGEYGFEENNPATEYHEDDNLETRCQAIEDFMACPTVKMYNDDGTVTTTVYGLREDGTQAAIDSVQSGLKNVSTSFDSIASQASDLFGITKPSDTELYSKILSLIKILVDYDETKFNNDKYISYYVKREKELIQISGEFVPLTSDYDSMYSNAEYSQYLKSMTKPNDFTMEALQDLNRFCLKTDKSNLQTIIPIISNMIDVEFEQLLSTKSDLEQKIYDEGVSIKYTSGKRIEDYVEKIKNALLDDVDDKTYNGNLSIDYYKDIVLDYMSVISTEIQYDLSSQDDFSDTVDDRLYFLDYSNKDLYKQWKNVMLYYGGTEFSLDPFYNIKNVTHPSYQIHPFLWNFVQKSNSQTILESKFTSKIVDDLVEGQSTSNVSAYIGEFGETINAWRSYDKGVVDFSGYITGYERSSHLSPNTSLFNEVVDYEGGFYPYALSSYLEDHDHAWKTVSSQTTVESVVKEISHDLYDELSSCISYDQKTGLIISQDVKSSYIIKNEIEKYNLKTKDIDSIFGNLVGTNFYSLTYSELRNMLSSSFEQTFYEKYYKHLGYGEKQYKYISEQLKEYYSQIKDLVEDKQSKNAYDIYKFGIDENGNNYLLYKTYGKTNPSYREKRNTTGRMWIRTSQNPISFPAFSGMHPQYYFRKFQDIPASIYKLAILNGTIDLDQDDKTIVSCMNSDMNVFFDFEMSITRSSIAYVSLNPDMDMTDTFMRRYDLAWVFSDQIHTTYDEDLDIELLVFKNSSSNNIDYVDFKPKDGMIALHRQSLEMTHQNMLSGIWYPSLIGSYTTEGGSIDFAFAYKYYKRILLDNTLKNFETYISPVDENFESTAYLSCFIVNIENGIETESSNDEIVKMSDSGIIPVGDNLVVSFDSNRNIIQFITTVVDKGHNFISAKTETSKKIDLDSLSEGSIPGDPNGKEFSSYDMFSTHIAQINITRNDYDDISQNSLSVFNMNADISYIPSYPGYENELSVCDLFPGHSYYNIELLGKSKDIGYYINRVNVNVNPYFDYDKIKENSIFGRVYEDYNPDEDKTFVDFYIPTLNTNMPSMESSSIPKWYLTNTGNAYEILVKLDNVTNGRTRYTDLDYRNLRMAIFNVDSLGKSPYFIGKLEDIKNKGEFDLEYDSNEISSQNAYDLKVVGTSSSEHTVGSYDSNHINGISNIRMAYSEDARTLRIRFVFDESADTRYVFVPSETIKILLFNDKDISVFKYYHMLDAYGAIHCRFKNSTSEQHEDEDNGWWTINYDDNDIMSDKNLNTSYYFDQYGNKKYLKDVDLDQETVLSDVYVFSGNKRLSFKYDEQLKFDLSSDMYYYPSLNLSYPKTPGQCIDTERRFQKFNLAEEGDVFSNENIFIINMEDGKSVIQNIGDVEIPISETNGEEMLAWEDYIQEDSDGIENCEKYDIDDPRVLEFTQFFTGEDSAVGENAIEIDDGVINCTSMDDAIDRICNSYMGIVPNRTESTFFDQSNPYIQTVCISSLSSIEDLEKSLKIYANYKSDQDGNITIYFNYFNYLNTPYVKFDEQGRIVQDIIDSTYLKLGPGEDGMLDLVFQYRSMSGTEITGLRNMTVLSYRIYNISDDKPKFLITKTYQIENQLHEYESGDPRAYLKITCGDLNLDEYSSGDGIKIAIDIIANMDLQPKYEFWFDYPGDVISIEDGNQSGYYIGGDSYSGMAHIIGTSGMTHLELYAHINDEADLSRLENTYQNMFICDGILKTEDGDDFEISSNTGYLRIHKDSMSILASIDNEDINIIKTVNENIGMRIQ